MASCPFPRSSTQVMRCYNHPEKEAVGICKYCSKGLCTECQTDLGYGLACKGKHEEAVTDIHAVISINTRTITKGRSYRFAMPIFFIFFGVITLGFGSFYKTDYLLMSMGSGFLVFGLYLFFYQRRIWKSEKT